VLEVAVPRPSLDAVTRGDGRATAQAAFDDADRDADQAGFTPMTRAEAEAFRATIRCSRPGA
jgi:hypothetical protein